MNLDLSPFFRPEDILGAKRLTGGRNNEAIRIETSNGTYVLKRYLNQVDRHQRFEREVSFLRHCDKTGVKAVPKLLEDHKDSFTILQQYIEGCRPKTLTDLHINSALEFIEDINSQSKEVLQDLPRAADSLQTGCELVTNLRIRFEILGDARIASALSQETYAQFSKLYSEVIGENSNSYVAPNRFLNNLKHFSNLIFLSPSDFGFHNCIESENGLVFIDFEYSGLDNPLKLILDFVYQPDFYITEGIAQSVTEEIGKPYGLKFLEIPKEIKVIFALKWLFMVLKRVFDNPPSKVDPSHAEYYFATRVKPLI